MLDLFAILSIGLMTGCEFAVSAFVNPAIFKLDEPSQAKAASLLARSLGKAMPIWYALCLILLAAEAYVWRHAATARFLYAAVAIWVLAIVYSIVLLVPINNEIARLDVKSPYPGWREDHKLWDSRHRFRIAMLVFAMALQLWAVVPST